LKDFSSSQLIIIKMKSEGGRKKQSNQNSAHANASFPTSQALLFSARS
jgi:hypothetical protein